MRSTPLTGKKRAATAVFVFYIGLLFGLLVIAGRGCEAWWLYRLSEAPTPPLFAVGGLLENPAFQLNGNCRLNGRFFNVFVI